MKCTWENCDNDAIHPQIRRDGSEWANLCKKHHNKLGRKSLEPSKFLRNWVLAKGGIVEMAKKVPVSPKNE